MRIRHLREEVALKFNLTPIQSYFYFFSLSLSRSRAREMGRKWADTGERRKKKERDDTVYRFLGIFPRLRPFLHDKSTTRSSLWPQIQLFGKLNLSKSRRPRCARALPRWKDAVMFHPPSTLPLSYGISAIYLPLAATALPTGLCIRGPATCMHVYLLELSGESAKNGIYIAGEETFG